MNRVLPSVTTVALSTLELSSETSAVRISYCVSELGLKQLRQIATTPFAIPVRSSRMAAACHVPVTTSRSVAALIA